MVMLLPWSSWRKPRTISRPSKHLFYSHILPIFHMRSFSDVSDTMRETAVVLLVGLTIGFLLLTALIVPSILRRGSFLDASFLVGFVLFGVLGFFALEIVERLSFLGAGVKFGVAGFIVLLILGALFGGSGLVVFISGSISGISLFYLMSVYAVYYIMRTETHEADETLNITELEPLDDVIHFQIEGIGSDFELLNNLVEKLSEGNQILYYARYMPDSTLKYRLLEETIRFYGNHLSPFHKIKSRDESKVIKQIAFEATYMDTMERGLFNYWLRAYITGIYTSVIVPFDDDFIDKAAVCERSYGGDLELVEILGDSDFLLLMDSLAADRESVIEVFTRWSLDELKNGISEIHTVD